MVGVKCCHTRANGKLLSGLWVLAAVYGMSTFAQDHPLGVNKMLTLRKYDFSPSLKNRVMAPVQFLIDVSELIFFARMHDGKRIERKYQRFIAGLLRETTRLQNMLMVLCVVSLRFDIFVETMSSKLEALTEG